MGEYEEPVPKSSMAIPHPKRSERLEHDCHATDVLREDLTNDGRVLRQGRRAYLIGPGRFKGLSRECDERPWQVRMPWRAMTVLGTSHARSLNGHEVQTLRYLALKGFWATR